MANNNYEVVNERQKDIPVDMIDQVIVHKAI